MDRAANESRRVRRRAQPSILVAMIPRNATWLISVPAHIDRESILPAESF